ncbi:hypothetical protein ACFSQ7_25145 [Paenibacillus rhizoplanae]
MLLAPILGPLLSGWLIEYINWHWIFHQRTGWRFSFTDGLEVLTCIGCKIEQQAGCDRRTFGSGLPLPQLCLPSIKQVRRGGPIYGR